MSILPFSPISPLNVEYHRNCHSDSVSRRLARTFRGFFFYFFPSFTSFFSRKARKDLSNIWHRSKTVRTRPPAEHRFLLLNRPYFFSLPSPINRNIHVNLFTFRLRYVVVYVINTSFMIFYDTPPPPKLMQSVSFPL